MENEIEVNGKKYVLKDSVRTPAVEAKRLKGLPYVIVRTYSAGVFAGYLKEQKGKEATILQARRLWYWDGAASLSQLAMEGVKKPENCKFPCEVAEIRVTEAIEVLNVTEKARLNIAAVNVWERKV